MFIIVIVFGIYKIVGENKENYKFENETESYLLSDEKVEEIEKEKIVAYIAGEVNSPGIYEMNENSRIADLIEKAGGLTELAALDKVNLAYKVEDGQKITIPCINNEIVGNIIIEDAGENILEENEEFEGKVNINTANVADLTKISGIGESTAQKIIDYRKNNGKFKSIADIKNISGIGESKYNQIKDYIKVK